MGSTIHPLYQTRAAQKKNVTWAQIYRMDFFKGGRQNRDHDEFFQPKQWMHYFTGKSFKFRPYILAAFSLRTPQKNGPMLECPPAKNDLPGNSANVPFLGWWVYVTFWKGESWPPTFGDKKVTLNHLVMDCDLTTQVPRTVSCFFRGPSFSEASRAFSDSNKKLFCNTNCFREFLFNKKTPKTPPTPVFVFWGVEMSWHFADDFTHFVWSLWWLRKASPLLIETVRRTEVLNEFNYLQE